MNVSIRDINTGQIVLRRAGLPAVRGIPNNASEKQCKSLAISLFNCTSEHQDFVYWVAVAKGRAIHKGSF